jgi:pimeloyl-ACP methyl ester carboxylesterase
MPTWTERVVESKVTGLPIQLMEQGKGPPVLLLHGFPELAYSWRRQLPAIADAGYRVIVPNQRGYGRSGCPEGAAHYTQLYLVGDMVGLLDALEEPTAVVIGHDWGAVVAWNCALLRPDRFRAVAALSAVFNARGSRRPTEALRALVGKGFMYMLHFQQPGVAESEFAEVGFREALRRCFFGASGDAPPEGRWSPIGPPGAKLFDGTHSPQRLPAWITEEDLDHYVSEFERTGLTGPLNWYRAMDATWEHMAPFAGARIMTPAVYIYGDQDPMAPLQSAMVSNLKQHVPNLRETLAIPGAGHWIQQERPPEVNAALLRFLAGL